MASEAVYESSDSARHAKPLRHVQTFELSEPLMLERGGQLPSVTVAYETYGELTPERDNAILVCHALSGDSHVASHNAEDDPGWWEIFVGPGKAIDTDRFFVICPNVLGGCRGTTGPHSVNPATGKRYGRDFPTVTVRDMVEVQRHLLDGLRIQRLLAVVGGSLGGHQALSWATSYPGRVRGVVALATSARLTTQALAFDVVGRNAIIRDPHFYNGQYYDKEHGPDVGLAIARMIGHITYLSPAAMTAKFEVDRLKPRDVPIEFEKQFSVGSYLGYQGARFVERFDANSYVTLSMAMDLFDLGGSKERLAEALKPATGCRWLVVSFSSDWLFPPEQSRHIVNALLANGAQVSYCNVESDGGHDAFLLEKELEMYGGMTRAFLDNVALTAGATAQVAEAHGITSIFHQHRLDYDRIMDMIDPGASVLDLGCGSGGLLARLKARNHARLIGVELNEENILTSLRRGLDVVQADLNKRLGGFRNGEFDYVVLSQTLQAVVDVEQLIAEMLRIGRKGIVSIPNFAYHRLRRMLAEEGRAPKSGGVLHYEWYNTPNIRFFTIADFEEFCTAHRISVHRWVALDTEKSEDVASDPNLNADLAIFCISGSAAGIGRSTPRKH